jgi:hypothetical protein
VLGRALPRAVSNSPAWNLSGKARPARRPVVQSRLKPWATEPPPGPPTVWIGLPFEGSPVVWLADCGPDDKERLLAWLQRNPALLELVGQAVLLQDEAEQ